MGRIKIRVLGVWAMRFYPLLRLFSRDRELLDKRHDWTLTCWDRDRTEKRLIKKVNREALIFAQIIQHCLARCHFVYAPPEGAEYQSARGQRIGKAQYVQYHAIRPSAEIIWFRLLINYRTLAGGYGNAVPYGVWTGNLVDDRTLYELSVATGRQVEAYAEDFHKGIWYKVYRLEGVGGLPIHVYFHDMLDKYPLDMSRGTLVMGVGLYHITQSRDLDDCSHIMIAGATRSGKSNMLNNLICGQLLFTDPSDVQFVLIDLKHLEFPWYEDSAHLFSAEPGKPGRIVKEADEAVAILKVMADEMGRRSRIMEKARCKKLSEWNRKFPDQKMPRLIVVIDEFAELMRSSGREVAQEVKRYIQRGSAVGAATGIHYWVCTQHPTSDVIDNSIKTNMQMVIAGRTQNWHQSITILGQRGAESLPLVEPKGRVLIQFGANLDEVQSPLITNDDIEWVVKISKGRGAGLVTMDGITPTIRPAQMVNWIIENIKGALPLKLMPDALHDYGITTTMWVAFAKKLAKGHEIRSGNTIYRAVRKGDKKGGWSLLAVGQIIDQTRESTAPPDEEPAESDYDEPTEEPETQPDLAPIAMPELSLEDRMAGALDSWRAMRDKRIRDNGGKQIAPDQHILGLDAGRGIQEPDVEGVGHQ